MYCRESRSRDRGKALERYSDLSNHRGDRDRDRDFISSENYSDLSNRRDDRDRDRDRSSRDRGNRDRGNSDRSNRRDHRDRSRSQDQSPLLGLFDSDAFSDSGDWEDINNFQESEDQSMGGGGA